MELEKAKKLAEELIAQYCPEYRFEFDNAKRRFGCCHWSKKKITLSRALVSLNDEARVENTIRHEIAHALCDRKDMHNAKWRRKAIEIGCDGERCYDSNKVETIEGKFVYQCPICKRHIHYHRRKRKSTACGVCCNKHNKGKYSDEFKLVYLGVRR